MNPPTKDSLLPDGIPKYVRCYDDGKSSDRYAVVFTGDYDLKSLEDKGWEGGHPHLFMSACPLSPRGTHSLESRTKQADLKSNEALGTRIKFQDLPEPCQGMVLDYYTRIWNLN